MTDGTGGGRNGRRPNGPPAGALVGIAGWLFADLLLALGLVFLASIGTFSVPVAHPAIQPSPSPQPLRCTTSISDKPRFARYESPDHRPPTREQLIQVFAAAPNEVEGLVQTKVTDVEIGRAYSDAQSINAQLAGTPGVIAGRTHFDDLGWQDPTGHIWLIEFTIYPFVTTCEPS